MRRRKQHRQPKERIWKVGEVFVAGDAPTITYNPRDEHRLEADVREYRDQPGKALSVSGPSKSGKTVLIERLFPKSAAIWVEGADLSSVDQFWRAVADALGAFDHITLHGEEGAGRTDELDFTVGMPKVVSGGGRTGTSSSSKVGRAAARTRPLPDLVREELGYRPWPIIVDDFQYVPTNARRAIARAIKTLITRTRVILIAVPHEAFGSVRAEPDMDGRIWQLEVEPWSVEELKFIARQGFAALKILDPEEVVGNQLALTSYGGPFLMQQLCHDYAVAIGVTYTGEEHVKAVEPGDWGNFFRKVASRTQPGVFEKLLRGPNPRGSARTARRFKVVDITTDIYGAVLYGIANVGVGKPIRYQEIVRALEKSLYEAPRSNQVTSALKQMAHIAYENRGAGDPALDFKDGEVHVMDPFLAFYLDYGPYIRSLS